MEKTSDMWKMEENRRQMGAYRMRMEANRRHFGIPLDCSLRYGMLGQTASRRVGLARAAEKYKERCFGGSGETSGPTSSLAVTPVQEIEPSKPEASQIGGATRS